MIDPLLSYLLRKCCLLQSFGGDEATTIPSSLGVSLASLDPTEDQFHVEPDLASPERCIVYHKQAWLRCSARRELVKLESEKQRTLDNEAKESKDLAIANVYTKLRRRSMLDTEITKLVDKCLTGEDKDLAKVLGLFEFIPKSILLKKPVDKYEQLKGVFDD